MSITKSAFYLENIMGFKFRLTHAIDRRVERSSILHSSDNQSNDEFAFDTRNLESAIVESKIVN